MKISHNRGFWIWISIIFFWVGSSGCIDEIDFDLNDAVIKALAVDGKIVKGRPSIAQVNVLRLTNAEILSSTIAVRDVVLENDLGQSLNLRKVTDGFFRSAIPENDPNFEVSFDRQYKISINTFDGRRLESSMVQMHAVPQIEDVLVEKALFDVVDGNGDPDSVEKMKFSLTTSLQASGENKKARLFWEVLRTYKIIDEIGQRCFIEERQSVSKFFPVDGNTLSSDRLDNFYFFDNALDYRYGHDAYVTVVQHSLSEEAFEFRRQVSDLSSREGSIFDDPVGALASNIKNVNDAEDPIFGYFFATETDTVHVFVDSLAADAPMPLCQPYRPPPPMTDCFTQCCNCLDERNSSLEKPSFWTDLGGCD